MARKSVVLVTGAGGEVGHSLIHRLTDFDAFDVLALGQARIRVQISAAHEPAHLERAVAAFVKVGRAHGVI